MPATNENDDGDAALVPVFKASSIQNPAKSLLAGRPIHDDCEVVEIRKPGSRDWHVHGAHEQSHAVYDPYSGERSYVTYAERFRKQYEQFKSHQAQTKSGTPLTEVGFLTLARIAELKGQNIYTIEALAAIDGNELKNLGYAGRDLKNKAQEYIAASQQGAPNAIVLAELEASKALMMTMQQELDALKANVTEKRSSEKSHPEKERFAKMTIEQLRAYIEEASGEPILGGFIPKAILLRQAYDLAARAKAAA